MSKLYGSITGDASKSDATRRGHRNISGHVRGWTLGVRVDGSLDREGREQFSIYATSGSGFGARDVLLGTVCLDNGRRVFTPMPTGEEVPGDPYKVPAVILAD